MIRLFIFLLLVLALGAGFAWIADRPGDVVLEWQGNEYQTSLMVVLVGLVVLIAAIMITWWLARTLLDSPQIMQRFFKARKKDRGYKALSQGLIAANSGDATSARKYTKESVRLLGREPLVDLLDAQSALLEGKREDARKRFEEMLGDDETRLVALRGLYLEAERQGAKDAARHYAEEAHREAPALPWAGNAKLRYASMDGDWEGALKALDANRTAGLIEKDAAKRQRAVLLTALAMSEEPADPVRAAKLAREAHKLAPTLVPAAIIGAKALARNSDIGRAAGMIETVWKKEPHPDLANSYVYLRLGDSASDRLKRAKKLAGMKANHPEGNFAIAEAAIDAQEWKTARDALKPILTSKPTERACLLMSEIEEAEFGDKGRMRDWLGRAVRAPKDAVWTADGYVSEKWLPISPITGKVDAFEWKVPVEQLDAPTAEVLDAEGLEDLIREPEVAPVLEEEIEVVQPVSDVKGAKQAKAARDSKAGSDANAAGAAGAAAAGMGAAAVVADIEADASDGDNKVSDEAKVIDLSADETPREAEPTSTALNGANPIVEDDEGSEGEATNDAAAEAASENEEDGPDSGEASSEPDGDESMEAKEATEATEASVEELAEDETKSEASFVLDRRPDDPGVREEDAKSKPKRFGIF